jgi:hypothetical protein
MALVYSRTIFAGKLSVFGKPNDYYGGENVAEATYSLGKSKIFLLRPNKASGMSYLLDTELLSKCRVEIYGNVTVTIAPDYVDGIVTSPGITVGILTADCSTIISRDSSYYTEGIRHPGKIFIGHGGRKSLVNHRNVLCHSKEEMLDTHEGIVQNLFKNHNWCPSKSEFYIACGIEARSFDHPYDYSRQDPAGFNQKMVDYLSEIYEGHGVIFHGDEAPNISKPMGRINLKSLAEAQARVFGSYTGKPFDSDNLDTFSNPSLWSRRSGDRGNNLVIIEA